MKTRLASGTVSVLLCALCMRPAQLCAEDTNIYLPVGGTAAECCFVVLAGYEYPERQTGNLIPLKPDLTAFAEDTSPIQLCPDSAEVGENGEFPPDPASISISPYKVGRAKIATVFPRARVKQGQPFVFVTTNEVIVYDLEPVLTPDDDFEGRSEVRFGIGERIALSANIEPAGVTAAQIGGIRWAIQTPVAGGGTLEDADNAGGGQYTAPGSTPDLKELAVRLRLSGQSGEALEMQKNVDISIVSPTGVVQTKDGDAFGTLLASSYIFRMDAISYLRPKDVSFSRIQVREGGCDPETNGSFDVYEGETHEPWDSPAEVGSGNAANGCMVLGPNEAGGQHQSPFDSMIAQVGLSIGAGWIKWDIPWKYTVGDAVDVKFTTLTYKVTVAVDEGVHKLKMEKGSSIGSISGTGQF